MVLEAASLASVIGSISSDDDDDHCLFLGSLSLYLRIESGSRLCEGQQPLHAIDSMPRGVLYKSLFLGCIKQDDFVLEWNDSLDIVVTQHFSGISCLAASTQSD
jgi:hypothetical protein